MPELQIERRSPAVPWWAWLIGVLLLALIIWWIVAAAGPERRAATVPPQEQVAGLREGADEALLTLTVLSRSASPAR